MALSIPSFKTDFNNNYNFENVVTWISYMATDFLSGNGSLMVKTHMDWAASADGSAPLYEDFIATGSSFPTGEVDEQGNPTFVTFPTLEQIIADNIDAFNTIRTYLYNKIATLPRYAGATVIPDVQ